MEVPLLDLKLEYEQLREEILAAIDGALSSMQLFLGPNVHALEHEFAALCGVKHAIGVGNGTEALHLCLRALGVGPGTEVITTPWTFIGTIEGIVHAGATPVVVDIEPETYCISPERTAEAITERTAAIMPVHIFGHPADMDALEAICAGRDIKIVEDAAQAHGAGYKGRTCGSLGACAGFSFYMSKNVGGYGEGGIITTNSDEVAEQVRLLRNHGHVSRFEHAVIGYNSRLDEVQAAVLRIKLGHLEAGNKRRRAIAAYYSERLAGLPLVTPTGAEGCLPAYHLYTIRAPRRDDLVAHLQERNIGSQTHYRAPAHLQPACRPYGLDSADLPNVMKASTETVQVPIYPGMTDAQVEYVAKSVREFYA